MLCFCAQLSEDNYLNLNARGSVAGQQHILCRSFSNELYYCHPSRQRALSFMSVAWFLGWKRGLGSLMEETVTESWDQTGMKLTISLHGWMSWEAPQEHFEMDTRSNLKKENSRTLTMVSATCSLLCLGWLILGRRELWAMTNTVYMAWDMSCFN